jgi:arginyl-tRNA synthetase
MADPKDIFKALLEKGARAVAPGASVEIQIERPKNPEHGDFSSNLAMQLAKPLKRNPFELANLLAADFLRPGLPGHQVEVVKPGFINLRLKSDSKLAVIGRVLREGAGFGRAKAAGEGKVQVEFVSANPTGPLHVGHGRQAALGDAIAALQEAQGYAVSREF